MSGEVRCCLRCGRWGERGFRPADNGADGHVCTNDWVCSIRASADKALDEKKVTCPECARRIGLKGATIAFHYAGPGTRPNGCPGSSTRVAEVTP